MSTVVVLGPTDDMRSPRHGGNGRSLHAAGIEVAALRALVVRLHRQHPHPLPGAGADRTVHVGIDCTRRRGGLVGAGPAVARLAHRCRSPGRSGTPGSSRNCAVVAGPRFFQSCSTQTTFLSGVTSTTCMMVGRSSFFTAA